MEREQNQTFKIMTTCYLPIGLISAIACVFNAVNHLSFDLMLNYKATMIIFAILVGLFICLFYSFYVLDTIFIVRNLKVNIRVGIMLMIVSILNIMTQLFISRNDDMLFLVLSSSIITCLTSVALLVTYIAEYFYDTKHQIDVENNEK